MTTKTKPVVAKVGEWTAIAAVATLASDYINDIITNWADEGIPWHHILGTAALAVVASLVAFVQNKAGTAAATTTTAAAQPAEEEDPAE